MKITYLFDPLCGWCYGAGPMIEKLLNHPNVSLALAPTGLFADMGARRMDKHFANYAWENDQRIAGLTGQVFSTAYRERVLEKRDGSFDSRAAILGIAAVGLTAPEHELKALKAIQSARYIDGKDNALPSVVAEALMSIELFEAARLLGEPDSRLLKTYQLRIVEGQSIAGEFHIQGVPALVAGEDSARRLIPGQVLFGRFDNLISQIAL